MSNEHWPSSFTPVMASSRWPITCATFSCLFNRSAALSEPVDFFRQAWKDTWHEATERCGRPDA